MKKTNKGIEAFSLPDIMRKQITALIKAGYYTSRSDVVKDALRKLMETNKAASLSAAKILYANKEISIEEAAAMCGKDEKSLLKAVRKDKTR